MRSGKLVPGLLRRRAAAKILDLSKLSVSAYLPALLLAAAVLVFGCDPFTDGLSRAGSVLATAWVLLAVIGVIVAVVSEAAALTSRGQTSGMSAMSLRVVSVGGDPAVTLEQAVIRTALPVVAAAVGALSGMLVAVVLSVEALNEWKIVVVAAASAALWLMVHLSAAAHADRRGWHDRAAGTAVIQDVPHARRRAEDEMNQRWKGFLHGQHDSRESPDAAT